MPKYCPSCGAANQNNALACSRCGKPFIIGTNPVNQNVNGKLPGASSAANKKEQSVFLGRNVIEVFLKVLKTPVSVGRKVVTEGRTAIGVSLIILQAFFTGLFGVIMIRKINELFELIAAASSKTRSSLGTLPYYLSEFGDAPNYSEARELFYKLSYIRGFLVSVFGSVALSFLVALIAMLLLMLFRVKTTFSSMLLATGIRCVGMIPVTVLAILVSFLHVGWGIVIFMVSAMIGYIFMGRVLAAGSAFAEDKVPYVLFFLVTVTIVIHCFMIVKIWPFYLPDEARADYYAFLREMKGLGGFFGMIKNMLYY